MAKRDLAYLKLLSDSYPSIQKAATEVINLQAILNLPKGTEFFLSDIHGEYDAFIHLVNSASGVIRDKINENFDNLPTEEKELLATLIYYPKEKLDFLSSRGLATADFYYRILTEMIAVSKITCSKYTRSKVRKLIAPDFVYIMEELLQQNPANEVNKEEYYKEIINGIIATGRAKEFIEETASLIQKSSVDHLHILGDIYDRGAGAFRIMETLAAMRSVDITWGNHDVVYMGAAAGNPSCVANVIRTGCRYNTLSTVEEGYGISLRPLVTFALRVYGNDRCVEFIPDSSETAGAADYDTEVMAKMHKAITIIQLKLDGRFAKRHPNYRVSYLAKLGNVDFDNYVYCSNGKAYSMTVQNFPTVNPDDPWSLTSDEQEVMRKLILAFKHSRKLKEHVDFLFAHGSMYLAYNSNLLYHGCIPTDRDGTFTGFFDDENNIYSGQDYLDYCDRQVRSVYLSQSEDDDKTDFFYFLWCGASSPLYGKSNITTFEKYFLRPEDLADFGEQKNPYYRFLEDPEYCQKILREFGISGDGGTIVNGHMPVKIKKGESPIKAGGKLIIIDGGICRAYQKVTGIAGYTLVYNSYGLKLIAHRVFESKDSAVLNNKDMVHSSVILDPEATRKLIKETDNGRKLKVKIADLMSLLTCYRQGLIKAKD